MVPSRATQVAFRSDLCCTGEDMNSEVVEALRAAQELCSYLWNNTGVDNPEEGNIEIIAHEEKHANQITALLNDARIRVDAALHGIEIAHWRSRMKYHCTNCDHECTEAEVLPAKDLLQRLEVGDIFTDVECPHCGALIHEKKGST